MNQDTSISPNEPDSDEGSKVYVSIASLAEDGVTPGIGDEVSFTVTGRIHSLEGDVACVTPETVNGEPAPQAPMSERDQLRGQMEAMDNNESY